MSGRLRIALIGCGWSSRNHLHAWQTLASEGAELIGVADVDPEKARRAAEEFKVPAFSGAGELLDELRPDLIDIVTPVSSHRELVSIAAERGIGAIVQKPIARDWAECLAMADSVEKRGGLRGLTLLIHFDGRATKSMMGPRQSSKVRCFIASHWMHMCRQNIC